MDAACPILMVVGVCLWWCACVVARPAPKHATHAQYLAHLRRAAMRLPPSFIDGIIGDVAKRCRRVNEAKGGHFVEGD